MCKSRGGGLADLGSETLDPMAQIQRLYILLETGWLVAQVTYVGYCCTDDLGIHSKVLEEIKIICTP